MTTLADSPWKWRPDTLIGDIVIENQCVNGVVSFRAKRGKKILLNGRTNFDSQTILRALRAAKELP